jgi:hypothetical protein
MSNAFGHHAITVAGRALIIQSVLVEEWTSAEAAATFGVSERQVEKWVADYRRRGMASLHRAGGGRITGKLAQLEVLRPVREAGISMAGALRRIFEPQPFVRPSSLRRSNDDRVGGE